MLENRKNWSGNWNQRKTGNTISTKKGKMFHPKYRTETPTMAHIDKIATPIIKISKIALHKMFLYVKIGDQEVGWMGTLMDNRVEENELFLKDVFLAKQEVSAVTTNLTPDGVAEMTNELMLRKDAMAVCNNLKFWGHSHVNMGVSPSAQDKETVEELRGDTSDYFLRGIFNKKGEVKFTLFMYDYNLVIDDVEWYSEDSVPLTLAEEIQKEFDEKVSERTWVQPAYSYYNNYGQGHSNYAGTVHTPAQDNFSHLAGGVRLTNDKPPLVRIWNPAARRFEDIDGNEIVKTGVWGYVNNLYRELTEDEVIELTGLDEVKIERAELEDVDLTAIEDLRDEDFVSEDVMQSLDDYDIDIAAMEDDYLEKISATEEEFLEFLNLKYSPGLVDSDSVHTLIERIAEEGTPTN